MGPPRRGEAALPGAASHQVEEPRKSSGGDSTPAGGACASNGAWTGGDSLALASLIRDTRQPATVKAVAFALVSRLGAKDRPGFPRGTCRPGLTTLQADAGVSRRTLLRSLDAIEATGLFAIVCHRCGQPRAACPGGRGHTLAYTAGPAYRAPHPADTLAAPTYAPTPTNDATVAPFTVPLGTVSAVPPITPLKENISRDISSQGAAKVQNEAHPADTLAAPGRRISEEIAGHPVLCPCDACRRAWANLGKKGARQPYRDVARDYVAMLEAEARMVDAAGQRIEHPVAYALKLARDWANDPKAYTRALGLVREWQTEHKVEARRRRAPSPDPVFDDDEQERKRRDVDRLREWERAHAGEPDMLVDVRSPGDMGIDLEDASPPRRAFAVQWPESTDEEFADRRAAERIAAAVRAGRFTWQVSMDILGDLQCYQQEPTMAMARRLAGRRQGARR
jgi:hypothetical protein